MDNLIDLETLDEAGRHTQATIDKERIEAETKTKIRQKAPQAPPEGLFEQQQPLLQENSLM